MGSVAPIVLLQTADTKQYMPMLQATAAVNQVYCARNNLNYSQFLGIKRGFHPWHATFNRIVILKEMVDIGFNGWVFYLDADALIVDLSYDIRRLISDTARPLVMAPGAPDGQYWDVNAGVFLIDLGNAAARNFIAAWYDDFMSTSDDALLAAIEWDAVPNDQTRLQKILRKNEHLQSFLAVADRHLLNYKAGKFVKQFLRANPIPWEERLAWVQKEAADVLLRKNEQVST